MALDGRVRFRSLVLSGQLHQPRRRRGQRLLPLQPSNDAVQAGARNELHDEIVQTVLFARAIDLDNVRMVQPGSGAGLAAEALDRFRAQQEVTGQHLQCDAAAQRNLFGLENNAHAAATDLADNAVVTQLAGNRPVRMSVQRGRACRRRPAQPGNDRIAQLLQRRHRLFAGGAQVQMPPQFAQFRLGQRAQDEGRQVFRGWAHGLGHDRSPEMSPLLYNR